MQLVAPVLYLKGPEARRAQAMVKSIESNYSLLKHALAGGINYIS